jgi:hypothetical protein
MILGHKFYTRQTSNTRENNTNTLLEGAKDKQGKRNRNNGLMKRKQQAATTRIKTSRERDRYTFCTIGRRPSQVGKEFSKYKFLGEKVFKTNKALNRILITML